MEQAAQSLCTSSGIFKASGHSTGEPAPGGIAGEQVGPEVPPTSVIL